MGLDMYLTRRTFLNKGVYIKEENREAVSVTKGGNPHPTINSDRISEIIEDIGYWRKANHIHQWFVDNVQKGVDDCKEYRVKLSQLEELLDVCKKVLKNKKKASELLPTQEGFFFGATGYDDWYFDCVQNTVNIIEGILSEKDSEDQEYFYQSSW